MAQVRSSGDAGGVVDSSSMYRIVALCESSAEKFERATRAEVSDPEATGMDSGDIRWLMLHAEHLIVFVDFVRQALSVAPPAVVPWEDWGIKAEVACRRAVELSDAAIQLAGPWPCWEAAALRGDVFAAAARLLGAVALRVTNPKLNLPASQALPQGPLGGPWEQVEASSILATCGSIEGGALDEAAAVSCAETAYVQAQTLGGQAAVATIGMAAGELFLDQARKRSGDDALPWLQRAAEAFQGVTGLAQGAVDAETVASAWYNLACVAALLGKPGHTAEALRRCLQKVDSRQRGKWVAEAREDQDLASTGANDAVQAVLDGK